MTLNVVIYARYSSDNQREASVEDQIRICRARAEREGWIVTDVFFDRAISGSTTDRPGYLELMRRIRDRRVNAVITESLDRISRDQEHLAAFYKLSSFSDVQIITLAEGQVSELHVGIKGMMGSLYLKDLAQKTKRGLAGRILAGRSCGTPPFGYSVVRRLNKSGEPERGLREINPAEATIVRRIFREFVSGASPMRIAKMLNSEGVPGPTGGIWWDSSIRGHEDRGDGVLRNPTYAGRLVWNRQQSLKDPELGTRRRRANAKDEIITQLAPELRIIDEKTWLDAQSRLAQEKAKKVQKPGGCHRRSEYAFWDQRRPKHLITGKVICGCCGRKFLTSGKDYMRCLAASNGACQNRISIRRPKLEAQVLHALSRNLMQPKDVADFATGFTAEWDRIASELASSATSRARALAAAGRKIDHIVDAIAEGGRNAALQAKLTKLTTEYEALEAAEAAGSPELPELTMDISEIYHARLARLQQEIHGKDAVESRERIRDLIGEIIIHPLRDDGDPKIEIIGDFASMLSLAGLKPEKGSQTQAAHAIDVLVSSIKGPLGALPPGPPPKAQP